MKTITSLEEFVFMFLFTRLWSHIIENISRARGYKTFFMLNSVEHEILNAHKYKNIKKYSFFQAKISGEGYFSCS